MRKSRPRGSLSSADPRRITRPSAFGSAKKSPPSKEPRLWRHHHRYGKGSIHRPEIAHRSLLSAILVGHFDFKKLWPILAGQEEALCVGVVGNAVEHMLTTGTLSGRVKLTGVEPSKKFA